MSYSLKSAERTLPQHMTSLNLAIRHINLKFVNCKSISNLKRIVLSVIMVQVEAVI
jgi:hypothetical protein